MNGAYTTSTASFPPSFLLASSTSDQKNTVLNFFATDFKSNRINHFIYHTPPSSFFSVKKSIDSQSSHHPFGKILHDHIFPSPPCTMRVLLNSSFRLWEGVGKEGVRMDGYSVGWVGKAIIVGSQASKSFGSLVSSILILSFSFCGFFWGATLMVRVGFCVIIGVWCLGGGRKEVYLQG